MKVIHYIYRHCGEEWGAFSNIDDMICPICEMRVKAVFSEVRHTDENGNLMEKEV